MNQKPFRPISEIVNDLRVFKKRHRLTQENIAKGASVSQSDVQRALAGIKRRPTGNLLKICEYAKISVYSESRPRHIDQEYERRIRECIADVWDGSSRQGKVIVGVLSALKSALRQDNP